MSAGAPMMNMKPGRMEFPNGYAIDIDEIWQGQVLYRVWPPGVETQGMFDRTYRMPIADFAQAVALAELPAEPFAHDEAKHREAG